MFRVGDYLIDPLAVELVPESVARENGVVPLSRSPGKLHVLLSNWGDVSDTVQKLQFILNRDIEYRLDDPSTVHEMVETVFSMQAAQVTRCNLHFELTCSRQWLELTETDSPDERHCPDCKETVYHCETEEQALSHAARGHCVCLHDPNAATQIVETMGMLIFPEVDPDSLEGRKEADAGR